MRIEVSNLRKYLITLLLVTLSIFTFANSDWSIDLDMGTLIKTNGTYPYLMTEVMYEYGFWRIGGEANIELDGWAIDKYGLFGKTVVFGKFANIYGELGLGVGYVVSDEDTMELKYKPETKILIDMGDFYFKFKLGILIENEFNWDNGYFAIGIEKRFIKGLDD